VSRGLERTVALVGPDHSYAPSWLERSVDELAGILAGYDVHHYADGNLVRSGGLETYFREQWNYARGRDPMAEGKPPWSVRLASDGFTPTAGQPNIDSYLHVWMVDVGAGRPRRVPAILA
jgi:hypothetical protein